jgi:hypothetical protein
MVVEAWTRSRSGHAGGEQKIPVGLGFKGVSMQLKTIIVVMGGIDYVRTHVATDE